MNMSDYRRNAGIMLLNKDGKVFMAQRSDARVPAWQMPQGGIDGDEKPLAAAVRELYEETGVKSVSYLAECQNWYSYDFPAGVSFTTKKKNYKGQTQKWFLFMFEGDESEIDLNATQAEFTAWEWVEAEEVPQRIVAFKKAVYENVLKEFLPVIKAIRERKTTV